MRILVPIDLHDSSHAAYEYAVNFAKSIGAEITLLHVIQSIFNANEVITYDPYLEMEKAAKTRLIKYTDEYTIEFGEDLPDVQTNIEIAFGLPGNTIAEYAESNNYDLIIMGVRDKHGFMDRILGSTSTETIKESKCPVMLIHHGTQYEKPEKILFAFDKKTDLDDALEEYKKINNILKAKTDFLHVNIKQKDDISKQKTEIVSELFEKEDSQFAFEIKSISGNNVLSGIKDYCFFENINLVALVQRKEGIFANLFTPNKGVKMAQEFQLPIITFQED